MFIYIIGLIIALISGLLSIQFIRDLVLYFFPSITDKYFDYARITFLIIGLLITSIKYMVDRHKFAILSNQIELVKYQEIAYYDVNGINTNLRSAKVNGVRMVVSPIDGWNNGILVSNHGKYICECNPSSIDKCKLVIEKMPDYPFSYYFLALCLKEKGNSSWRENAHKAKSILENTTKFPKHHPDHDLILLEVNKLIYNN